VSRPSAATILAALALFVALGGTSYAVSKLPKNSVGSEQVRDGSLTAADLSAGAASSGPRGPRGAQGPAGAPGATGPQGPAALPKGYVDRLDGLLSVPAQSPGTLAATAASLRLPAGHYGLQFTAHAYVESGGRTFIACRLTGPGGGLTTSTTALGATEQPAQQAALALADVTAFDGTQTVSVTCSTVAGTGSVKLVDARLVALPLSAIEEQ
jgi:hypothetical protein